MSKIQDIHIKTIDMWLRLAFIQCTIYAVYFTSFCIYYPKNYLDYFVQGQFHLPTTQFFFWKQGVKLEVLLGFENFQIVAHEFLRYQFLGNNRIFYFGQVLIHQINFRDNLHWPHVLFLDRSLVYFQNLYSSIWLRTLSNNLRNFKNCQKNEKFLHFFHFFDFSFSRDAVKQLGHSWI